MWFSMFSKWYLAKLKVYIEKNYFAHGLKTFWVAEIEFPIATKWIKEIPRKKPKVFQFTALPHYIRQFLITS